MLTLHASGRVHPKVMGVTRDLRVLWMLEECGLPHQVRGLDHTGGELNSEAFRRLSPFVQLPVLEDDGFVLTESGAILLYLAEKSGRLLPADPQGRAQRAAARREAWRRTLGQLLCAWARSLSGVRAGGGAPAEAASRLPPGPGVGTLTEYRLSYVDPVFGG